MPTTGSWSVTYQAPIIPVVAAMLPTGSILMWSSNAADTFELDIGTTPSSTLVSFFDPTSGAVSSAMDAGVQADMFCPGISYLPNGQVLIAGGSSSSHTTLFNPFAGQYGFWAGSGDMNIARGYNSAVTLSNGDVFTIGGSWSGTVGPKDGELWSPTTGWTLTGIAGYSILGPDLIDQAQGYVTEGDDHAWLFTMPNGRVFYAGPAAQMDFLDPLKGTVTLAGSRGDDQYSVNGDAVMYAPGKILKVGGAPLYHGDYPASNAAYLIDISQDYTDPTAMAMPIVTRLAPMNFARAYSNAVVLPDGEVFIVGGQTVPHSFTDDNAVMTPEMWNPVTMQFTELAPMPTPRDYHSAALLMPDGRIWVGGGGDCGACPDDFGTPDPSANHPDFEIFTPPYLYGPDGSLAARPVISSAPTNFTLGNKLTVSASGNVANFSLVRLGTSTHTIDSDQRRVPLTIERNANGTFTLDVPSDPGTTVPGYWMLFALDANGVPSVSKIIQISNASLSATTKAFHAGDEVTGYLSAAGQDDFYTLELTAGATYYVGLLNATVGDPLVVLRDPFEQVVLHTVAVPGEVSSYTATVTGTYTLHVSSNSLVGLGSYTLMGGDAIVKVTDVSTNLKRPPTS